MNRYFKLMWIPKDERVLWEMQSATQIELSDKLYSDFNHVFNLYNWISDYEVKYKKWLSGEDDSIYNINSPNITEVIEKVKIFNLKSNGIKVFFWFDVDRTFDQNFKWEICPLCGSKLEVLEGMPKNNKYICKKDYLTFPE